jgi:S-adenosylmethionine hydrolase
VTSRPIITLTTDFGLSDSYVAVMKGVVLGIAPETVIVDVSHQIAPQDVLEAAYVLRTAYRYFPATAIHVAVVDPGVGTRRKALGVKAPHGLYVGPDNGIFCSVLEEQEALNEETGELVKGTAVDLTNEDYWRKPVSQTFHGRDIFAPVAAHLARGISLDTFGPAVTRLHIDPTIPPVVRGGAIFGRIVHIDRFGNAVSNVRAEMLPGAFQIEIGGRVIEGLAASYQDARVVAIIGSSGLLEIAARNASAAEGLGLRRGDPLVVRVQG